MVKRIGFLVVNFGGPRSQGEVLPFLNTLLCDQDVVKTGLPQSVHELLFKAIAKKRTPKIQADYRLMGGASPIHRDTEKFARSLEKKLGAKVMRFHRYLPSTHSRFIEKISEWDVDEIYVFPMFPQFSYATSGSIARFFDHNLPKEIVGKLSWVKSYPGDKGFIDAYASRASAFLKEKNLHEEQVHFFYTCHGLPKKFVKHGDPYEMECRESFEKMKERFPRSGHLLAYQSKFGPGEWLRPYTEDMCEKSEQWLARDKTCVLVPLSFTSDHIETLYEIENDYLPILQKKGFNACRMPALNLDEKWIEFAASKILQPGGLFKNDELFRKKKKMSLI